MPALILTIAGWFGINPFRLIMYVGIGIAVISAGVTIRQHYVNLGYSKAIAAVKKQDNRAIEAARQVEKKASECTDNSYWDVLSQNCKLGDDK